MFGTPLIAARRLDLATVGPEELAIAGRSSAAPTGHLDGLAGPTSPIGGCGGYRAREAIECSGDADLG